MTFIHVINKILKDSRTFITKIQIHERNFLFTYCRCHDFDNLIETQ